MDWELVLIPVFITAFCSTVGFAVKGFLLYKTAENITEEKRGRMRCIAGVIGTFIVAIIMFIVIFSGGSDNPGPSESTESVNVTSNQIESSSQDEGSVFRRNAVFDVGTYTGYVDRESKLPSGQGIMEYIGGDKYDGEWLNGQRHGNGTMFYASGDTYDGEWCNGVKDGYGVYTWSTEEMYQGYYKNDLRDGEGAYIGWTGFQTDHGGWRGNYYGTSVGDVFEGYGKFEFDNGDLFEGVFHNNEFWQGMYTYHDGTQRKIDESQVTNSTS